MTTLWIVLCFVAIAGLYFYVGYASGYEKGLEERDKLWDRVYLGAEETDTP